MTTQTTDIVPVSTEDATFEQERTEVSVRFHLAAVANTALFDEIPNGCILVLLPDDDPDYVARQIATAAGAAQRGENVYLRHLRMADLPPMPDRGPNAPPAVGLRRTFFNRDGSVRHAEVVGLDGQWHELDPATVPPANAADDWTPGAKPAEAGRGDA